MFGIGDKLEIVNEWNGHEFRIGEIVTVNDIDKDTETPYSVTNNVEEWWVSADEVKLIESAKPRAFEDMTIKELEKTAEEINKLIRLKAPLSRGSILDIGDGIYMVCQTGLDKFMLISLYDGNRYTDTAFTREEMNIQFLSDKFGEINVISNKPVKKTLNNTPMKEGF